MSYLLADIEALVQPYGLIVRGSANVIDSDLNIRSVLNDREASEIQSIVIVGSHGNSAWQIIKRSVEYLDGKPDPLDRWTLRIGTDITEQLNANVVFPFQGPPYAPFLSWAQQLDSVEPSKLGMFIHPEYGLWHAYRFALLLSRPLKRDQSLKK